MKTKIKQFDNNNKKQKNKNNGQKNKLGTQESIFLFNLFLVYNLFGRVCEILTSYGKRYYFKKEFRRFDQ